MKILVVAWRAWSAVSRHRSLMVNAQREGHKVMCIVSDHLRDSDLTMAALKEIKVRGARGDKATLDQIMAEFNADAVFGEYYWSVAEEDWVQQWALNNNRPHFLLDHHQYHGFHQVFPSERWRKSQLLAVNASSAKAARKTGWRAHVVGQPDLDVIDRNIDIGKVKSRLRCKDGQPLVALFLEHISGTGSPPGRPLEPERTNVSMFMKLARERGWRVVVHCHAQERKTVAHLYHPQREAYLKELQDKGITFVAGWAPGTIGSGVKFERCTWHELILAADAVTGTTMTPIFMAYACGKTYFLWYGEDRYGALPTSRGRVIFRRMRTHPNYSPVGGGFSNIIAATEAGATIIEHEQSHVKRWFYKLDGNCWKRMLKLAAK